MKIAVDYADALAQLEVLRTQIESAGIELPVELKIELPEIELEPLEMPMPIAAEVTPMMAAPTGGIAPVRETTQNINVTVDVRVTPSELLADIKDEINRTVVSVVKEGVESAL